jgi:hypothetical protein
MACTFTFKGKEYTDELELLKVLGDDPDLIADFTKQFRESNQSLSEATQEESLENSVQDVLEIEKGIDVIYSEALARVTNVYEAVEPKSRQDKSNAAKVKAFENISIVKKSLEDFRAIDKAQGLTKYVSWTSRYISKIDKRISDEKARNNGKVSEELVRMLVEWNAMFDLLEDIDLLLEAEKTTFSKSGSSSKFNLSLNEIQSLQKALKKVSERKKTVDTSLLELERESYANLMADNDIRGREMNREKFVKRWNAANSEILKNDSDPEKRRMWVQGKMEQHAADIREESYQYFLVKAVRSSSNIAAHVARFASEKQMGSEEIQVASRMVDGAERKIQEHTSEQALAFKEAHKEFSLTNGTSQNLKERYKGMLDLTSGGEYYFASEYQAQFYETQKQKRNEATNSDLYDEKFKGVKIVDGKYKLEGQEEQSILLPGDIEYIGDSVVYYLQGERYEISVQQAIGRSEFSKWTKENTRKIQTSEGWRTMPISTWINKSFEEMSDEKKTQLKFLTDSMISADEDTKGVNSLIKQAASQSWIKLPAWFKKAR